MLGIDCKLLHEEAWASNLAFIVSYPSDALDNAGQQIKFWHGDHQLTGDKTSKSVSVDKNNMS